MRQLVNPFELPGRWYKAGLHIHSTVSDGPLSPRERVDQYRKAGYAVVALTDHRRTQDVRGLGDKRTLVISGMEYHPICATPPGWFHLVALGVPQTFKLTDPPKSANRAIAKVARAGGISILAHPAWCGQEFADFKHLRGVAAIEVYNSTCDRAGRGSSEMAWAVALDRGWRLPAVGVDDCHCADSEDVCESWTWLKMPRLSVAEALKAISSGACYASCGPEIRDFRIAGGKVHLRCSPAAQINFAGPPGQGRRRRAEPGKTVRSFSIDVPDWAYVRPVVTDPHGRKAWANPIFL